jgi:hypothetical protein
MAKVGLDVFEERLQMSSDLLLPPCSIEDKAFRLGGTTPLQFLSPSSRLTGKLRLSKDDSTLISC